MADTGNTVTAYHGTPDPAVEFSTEGDRVIYFTSDRTVAETYARAEGCGGLFPGEVPTLVHAQLTLRRPLVIRSERQWEQLADQTVIDKAALLFQGYDSIVHTNEWEVTYYVLFDLKDCTIIQKETLL